MNILTMILLVVLSMYMVVFSIQHFFNKVQLIIVSIFIIILVLTTLTHLININSELRAKLRKRDIEIKKLQEDNFKLERQLKHFKK